MNTDWLSRITLEPGKRGGQPCIRGMRMTAQDVLSYLAGGMSVDEVLADFPYLTKKDVQACFAYAAGYRHCGNRDEIAVLQPTLQTERK